MCSRTVYYDSIVWPQIWQFKFAILNMLAKMVDAILCWTKIWLGRVNIAHCRKLVLKNVFNISPSQNNNLDIAGIIFARQCHTWRFFYFIIISWTKWKLMLFWMCKMFGTHINIETLIIDFFWLIFRLLLLIFLMMELWFRLKISKCSFGPKTHHFVLNTLLSCCL